MSAHPFLPMADQACVTPDLAEAVAAAVVIDGDAEAPDLVALARTRLKRLADHLDLVAAVAGPRDSDAAALASFVQPQLAEACNLLRAAEHGLASSYTRRA